MTSRESGSVCRFSAALLDVCAIDESTPAWQTALKAGWDMTLVADALGKPLEQRVREHRAALRQIEFLREHAVIESNVGS